MKIDLLMRGEFVSRPKVQDMHRTAALRKVSHVFYKRIPRTRQLPVEKKGSLSCRVSRSPLRRPIDREHAGGRPVRRELVRPRDLHLRVIAMARYQMGAGWKTERNHERDVEPVNGPKLLLDPGQRVAPARSEPAVKREF